MTPQIDFLDQIEAALKDLDLGQYVTREKFPDDGQFTRTGLILSWDDEKAIPGSNEQDDVVYTAVLVLTTGSTRASASEYPSIDSVRDKVYIRFNNKRVWLSDEVHALPAGPCKVVFGTNGLPEQWMKNRYSGVVQIQGRYRRTRDAL